MQRAKDYFKYKISEKKVSGGKRFFVVENACTKRLNKAYKKTAPELPILAALKSVVFIDMNTYIFTEGRNVKTYLKENDAVAFR